MRLLHGDKRDLLHEISTSSSDQFDFIFHDGGHRGDDYVEDFEKRLSPYFVMKQLSLLMTFDGMKKAPESTNQEID